MANYLNRNVNAIPVYTVDQKGNETALTWTVDTSQSGTLLTSGATVSITFVNNARQEVINPSASTIWARWNAVPAVNGAGSFPLAPGGSYSTDRTSGTLQLLSTAATQSYTVNRFA